MLAEEEFVNMKTEVISKLNRMLNLCTKYPDYQNKISNIKGYIDGLNDCVNLEKKTNIFLIFL